MIEYQDGTYSEIMEATEATEKLREQLDALLPDGEENSGSLLGEYSSESDNLPRALHLGTREELEKRKEQGDLEERLGKLERAFADIERKRESPLEMPDAEQIKRLAIND